MAQVGVPSAHYGGYGSWPVFSGLTLLEPNLKTYWFFEDFIAVQPTLSQPHGVWTSYYAGAGAQIANWPGDQERPGIAQLATGTTAVGYSSLISSYGFTAGGFQFGAGVYTLMADIALMDLSTVAEEFDVRFGWSDQYGPAIDGVYFQYDRNTSLNWSCVTANNSVRTLVDSGVVVAEDVWVRLKIVVNAAGTAAAFYINGVLVATITTNIPTADGRETLLNAQIVKSAGLTSRTLLIDWTWLHYDLTVSR